MSLACKTIADYTDAAGAMPMLFSIRDCIPFAFSGLLIAIFLILFAGNYFLIKSRTGRAKVLIAVLSASFVTTTLAMFLVLGQLVEFNSVLLWAFISIVSFILLIISDKQ